ncbi:YdaU family protein [Dyella sp. 2RAB6]|uniref:YdaU family protein n=1 Tax=Dyella sp. 2RAB6 TaxID=3232992 RepID=UPI003F8F34DB
MIYYHRYPADYAIGAGGLSMIEDGAYGRLMDFYYGKEEPIEHGRRYNVARATSPAEKRAVDAVLAQFFKRDGDLWRHHRIDEEIAKAQPRIEAARANGKKGGRPPTKKPPGNPPGNPPGFQQVSQQGAQGKPGGETGHTSYVNNSVGSSSTSADTSQATDAQARAVVGLCKVLLKLGMRDVHPARPELLELVDRGCTPEQAALTAAELALKKAGMKDDPDFDPELLEKFASGCKQHEMHLTDRQFETLRNSVPSLGYLRSTLIGRAHDAARNGDGNATVNFGAYGGPARPGGNGGRREGVGARAERARRATDGFGEDEGY